MKAEPGLLSHGAYARSKGWSQQYVSQLVKKGKLPTVGGKIDPEAADRALADNSDPRMSGVRQYHADRKAGVERDDEAPGDLFDGMTQNEAQTAKLRIQAKLGTLEYDREVGKLVELSALQSAVADLVPNATTLLDSFPDRIAARVAAETDVRTVYAIIEAECTAVRQQIADFAKALNERLNVNPS